MRRINMKQWMYSICNSVTRKAMPVLVYPGAELTGINIDDMVKDGEKQYMCIKAVRDRFPSAAVATAMDLSVEPEAFGSPIRFSDRETPTVTEKIVSDEESIKKLGIPSVGTGRTGEYIKAARLASENITDCPVFGGMIGPYSLAARLYDITELMVSAMLEPDIVHMLLEKCIDFLIEYAKAFKNAGADGIIIAEPAAGLLSPDDCRKFSSDYIKRLIDAVQDDYFMIILHNCGNTEKLVSSMLSTGAMGFHFGNSVDMAVIMPQIPWGRLAFGNVDPAGVLKNGSAEDVREKTLKVLEGTAIYKNFVLSSGCDVPPGTPKENIDAFFDALEEFNSTIVLGRSA